MKLVETVKQKARLDKKTIVLPEGEEKRTILASEVIAREGIADPVLIGRRNEIEKLAEELGADLKNVRIEDPDSYFEGDTPKEGSRAKVYAEALFELRKAKGLTKEAADKLVKDPMYYGIMMVKLSDADGLVSGAIHTTGDMLRPALQVIKTKPGTKLVSSSFLMECPDTSLGADGLLVYADCVVVPCPTAEELACIAVSAAETAKVLCGIEEPQVAMLSFSTKGSAEHELVTKVREAVRIAHEIAPELSVDGELQLDAALVPSVAELKAKGSSVAGHANVLIFPDLQAGNIGYKITQRIGKAECFAVLQGLAKPCNDLSRGCSVDDIVNTVAMTAVQAQAL